MARSARLGRRHLKVAKWRRPVVVDLQRVPGERFNKFSLSRWAGGAALVHGRGRRGQLGRPPASRPHEVSARVRPSGCFRLFLIYLSSACPTVCPCVGSRVPVRECVCAFCLVRLCLFVCCLSASMSSHSFLIFNCNDAHCTFTTFLFHSSNRSFLQSRWSQEVKCQLALPAYRTCRGRGGPPCLPPRQCAD